MIMDGNLERRITFMKKIGKRLLVSILSVLMLVSLTPAMAFADGETETPELVLADSDTGLYTSWYDASADSFELTRAQDLMGLALLVNEGNTFEGKTVKLANDISLSGYGNWITIGSSQDTPFAGTFNGMNHTVSDLAITDCTGGYKGLFGYNKGTICDLTVSGKIGSSEAFITSGSDNIGGLVGYNDGTVTGITGNVSVYINTSSIYAAGGIVGQNGDEGIVKECINSADVTATKHSGGVVGRSYGEITLCKNTGNITGNGGGKDGIGGIVGLAGDKNSTYPNSVTYCYNTGTISNDNGRWHGGIAGMADSSASISNCYDTGQITPGYSWNWNPVIGHVDSAYETVKDNYSLEGLNAGDSNESTKPLTVGTVKTAEEMYADEFVDLINGEGSGFQSSCGYPVLSWEKPAAHTYGEGGVCTVCGQTKPEETITVIYGETTKELTESEIDALAGEESTKSFTGHNGTTEITAAFIKLTDVLAAAGWTKEEFCCFRLEAGDGFTANITAEQLDEAFIYKQDDGSYRSAIDGSAGKMWVSGLVKITEIKEHSYGEDGACTVCGKTEVKASVELVVDGESTTIEGSDIEALAGEETTKSYTGKGGEVSITAKFTKLTDLFENAGVNLEKVKYPVRVSAADGFTAEVDKDQLAEMYIYKQDDGTYRTAVDGSAGKLWVSGAAKIEIETDVNCPSEKFSDLDTSRWYHDAIDHVLNNHYFNGMSDTTFEPDSSMTRAMFVTVLSRMEGIDPSQYTGSSFSDVETGEWYSEAIQWASQNEIVKGVGNGKFDKNGNVTREQMAVILYNYAKFKGIDTSAADASKFDAFTDKASVSGWAVDAMTWATSIGIINGMGDNTLAPKESSTRAQVAQIIKNFTDKAA